ncbi:hypothetical protein NMG60_11002443 [Bertholletia excelsa]
MGAGDMFCVSAKKPLWFALRRAERDLGNESELAESLQGGGDLRNVADLELDLNDVSEIDPVKEFGFLVIGHEFDHYPKQKLLNPKNWDWFLEEPKEDSEDDEVTDRKARKGLPRKRKKGEGAEDEEWTGESEDEKELIPNLKMHRGPNTLLDQRPTAKL